jgi:hypothetical protein
MMEVLALALLRGVHFGCAYFTGAIAILYHVNKISTIHRPSGHLKISCVNELLGLI